MNLEKALRFACATEALVLPATSAASAAGACDPADDDAAAQKNDVIVTSSSSSLDSLYLTPKTLVEVITRLSSSSASSLPTQWVKSHSHAVDILASLPPSAAAGATGADLAGLVNLQAFLQSLPTV